MEEKQINGVSPLHQPFLSASSASVSSMPVTKTSELSAILFFSSRAKSSLFITKIPKKTAEGK